MTPVNPNNSAVGLVDIQSSEDLRNIAIDKVGVKKVKYPMMVRERDNGTQQTVGEFTLTVDLPKEFKGTYDHPKVYF